MIHWSKSTERTTTRVNPEVNYELWVIMMFIDYNKCPTLVVHVDIGEAMHVRWQGFYEKSRCLALNCAVNRNLL